MGPRGAGRINSLNYPDFRGKVNLAGVVLVQAVARGELHQVGWPTGELVAGAVGSGLLGGAPGGGAP